MSKQKAKFELFARLHTLGFTYEEAVALRRIEMTLSRWGEAECNGEIERNEETGRPFRRYGNYLQANDPRSIHYVADREAGALKRLKAIINECNARNAENAHRAIPIIGTLHAYHQSDPRGCSLYIVRASDLPDIDDEAMRRHSGEWPLKTQETRLQWKLSCYYTRGLAVCA